VELPFNSDDYSTEHPALDSSEKTLYFSSDRPGGFGGKDIYRIQRGEDGRWSTPTNLGPKINTKLDEKSPFIHTDNQTLYFSSTGHQGMGGFDIFYSRFDDDLNWNKPKNIGTPINSESDDLGFFVSTDGKTGYFSSNKIQGGAGSWDIYRFRLYEGARPKKVFFIKGEVRDEKENILPEAKIAIRNLKTNEVKEIEVDKKTGEYVFTQLLEEDQMVTVENKNFFYKSQLILKEDTNSSKPMTVDFKLKEVKVGEAFVVDNILFKPTLFDLNVTAEKELDNLIRFLGNNPSIKISINGHTDIIGDKEENVVLSRNRAKSVVDYLLAKKISSNRLKYEGFGQEQPIASNKTDEGRALNRRTEILILEK
ncbi:MAG: OmpA family protein, partial [Bacteroidetes bacterium]|nr:OmpA family protein [Bacteroidota bacterium]